MTKTLTEQWREGTLPDGKYYIKLEPNFTERYDIGYSEGGDFVLYNIEDIEEVLAPVPSYKDYKKLRELPLKCFQLEEDNSALMVINKDMCKEIERLQKQLAIATKALKKYADEENWRTATTTINTDYFEYKYSMYDLKDNGFEEAQQTLKEMEGVK